MAEPKTPADVVRFPRTFPMLKSGIDGGGRVRIVAVGSSSTAGRGDVIPYPYWLEWTLRQKLKRNAIDVINRGIIGEDAPEEVSRLHRDAVSEQPAMIVWQVGSNAIFHADRYACNEVALSIEEGLDRICLPGIDVLVMDLQYTPALLRPEKWAATFDIVQKIETIVAAKAATGASVQLFRRFALMKYWNEIDGFSLDRMTDPSDDDRLHQSEWSTRKLSWALCNALAAAI